MAGAQPNTRSYQRRRKTFAMSRNAANGNNLVLGILLVMAGAFVVYWVLNLHARYTLSLQSPIELHFQWPLVIAHRVDSEQAEQARRDQRRPLTAYQQY